MCLLVMRHAHLRVGGVFSKATLGKFGSVYVTQLYNGSSPGSFDVFRVLQMEMICSRIWCRNCPGLQHAHRK